MSDVTSSGSGAPPGLDPHALRRYLDGVRPGMVTGELSAQLIAGGRSNLTYLVGDGTHEWVVRRPPLGHVLATAHDMSREYRVMTALGGSPVPVPRTYLLCTDPDVLGAPFYVMERVIGTVYRTDTEALALGAQRAEQIAFQLVDVLARLHALDPEQVGLADFGRPAGFLDRQLRRWQAQLEASHSRTVDGIAELRARLARAVPAPQRAAVLHGDYRLDNVMIGSTSRAVDGPGSTSPADDGPGDEIVAVLDWEMSTLGDPLADLGLLAVYWSGGSRNWSPSLDEPRPSLLPWQDVVRRYAERTGLDLTPLPWYVAFGYFKLAVILEGIHYRYVTGKTVGEGFATAGKAVAPLVARGLATLG
ncbi:MAG TPA: phosphotransferase family protein [Micromonosporaceae bacterium]